MGDRWSVDLPSLAVGNLFAEMYRLDGHATSDKEKLTRLAARVSSTFDHAFYPSGARHAVWSPEHVAQQLSHVSLATIVRSEGKGEDVAYALFSSAVCDGRPVLFVDSMGIAGAPARCQGKGIGRWLVVQALERYPSPIVAARTQNPAFVEMLRRLKPAEILPGPEGYRGPDRTLLESIVRRFGAEWADRVELATGICRSIYTLGRLGEYSVDRANPSIERTEDLLQRLGGRSGFHREAGDAVVVLAKGVAPGTVVQRPEEPR